MLASTLPAGTSAKGISGAVTAIRSLSGPMLVGTSLSWRPLPNLFIRWGIAYAAYNGNTPGTSTDALSYSWGVGYDDWHPGTISVTINNWGPIKFKPGIAALSEAVLDIGYKIPFPAKVGKWINASVKLTQPFNGLPSTSVTLGISPLGRLFAFASLRVAPFDSEHLTWSYGFGYADSRPFHFSLTYDNWGPNTMRETGFFKRGSITGSFTWSI